MRLSLLPFVALPIVLPVAACASMDEDMATLIASEPGSGDWRAAEAGVLENHVQLTFFEQFRKAGECYFSPDDSQIIFQAVEKMDDESQEEAFYQMYVADLVHDGSGRVTGIENLVRLSPPGSSNTCGWFHPTEPGVVIFGSTIVPPVNPERAGYQRDSSRYSWQFPAEMTIVRCEVAKADATAATLEPLIADDAAYLAECVVSADGRYLVYCEHKVAEGVSGGDLLIRELATGRTVSAAVAAGYDGGPFFSPDGKRLCYRSDRRGDDLLQIFVSELEFDDAGELQGVAREFQLTDNGHVNWAPYWHPAGKHLVYTGSAAGHTNYEVYLVDAAVSEQSTKYGTGLRRVTNAGGFDGLPVFTRDGSRMMWTSQRSEDGTSQVWIADFVMPLEGVEAVAAAKPAQRSEGTDQKPEQLKVQDPDTGLYYLYDPATHELSVYDIDTHQVRAADAREIERAMQLFGRDS